MKTEIKFYENIGVQLEITSETDIEKYALTKLFEDRQQDFIVIK